MNDKRIKVTCDCKHAWLIERKRIKFNGSPAQQEQWERFNKRKWNQCYCGTDLYKSLEKNESK